LIPVTPLSKTTSAKDFPGAAAAELSVDHGHALLFRRFRAGPFEARSHIKVPASKALQITHQYLMSNATKSANRQGSLKVFVIVMNQIFITCYQAGERRHNCVGEIFV